MREESGSGDFYHREFRPGARSAAVVERYWVIRARRCGTLVEAALPDSAAEIYINLGPTGREVFDPRRDRRLAPRAAWIVGPRVDPLLVAKEIEHCDVVGVRLHPGVVSHLFGVAAAEVRGGLVDLDELWGAGVGELRERLAATADPRERVRLVDEAIGRRLVTKVDAGSLGRIRAVCDLVARMPSGTTGTIARALGLSHRRLIALFDAGVGLKPKTYHRVRRLRRVFDMVSLPERPPWARVAVEAGYVDQAHMIHEFRDLTGMTPAAYERERTSVGSGFVPHTRAAGRQPSDSVTPR